MKLNTVRNKLNCPSRQTVELKVYHSNALGLLGGWGVAVNRLTKSPRPYHVISLRGDFSPGQPGNCQGATPYIV